MWLRGNKIFLEHILTIYVTHYIQIPKLIACHLPFVTENDGEQCATSLPTPTLTPIPTSELCTFISLSSSDK